MKFNLFVRLLLEVCSLVAFAYWGYTVGPNVWVKVLLGIGIPVIVIILWGMFGAPAAKMRFRFWGRFVLEVLIYGGAALALWGAGKPLLAIIFAIVIVVNRVLMLVWKQG